MNTKTLMIAAALLLNGAAHAQTTTATADAPKTRAQVLAELEQARADRSFYAGGDGSPRGLARSIPAERLRQAQAQAPRPAAPDAPRAQN